MISDSNSLTSPIPSELGLLTELTFLVLCKSFLSFYFVHLCYENIHSFARMSFFILNENALTGPIPSELGLLTALPGCSFTFRVWIAPKADPWVSRSCASTLFTCANHIQRSLLEG